MHINSVEFYDLSPVEFYFALKSVGDYRLQQQKDLYEVARLQAAWLINVHPHVKPKLRNVYEIIRYPWEKSAISPPKIQTQDEMKNAVLMLASALGAKQGTRHPDDPPTNLVKRRRKR